MNFRIIVRHLYLSIVGLFKKPKPGVHIITGHYINRYTQNIKDKEEFRDLLNKLSKYVTFINIEDAIDLIVRRVDVDKPLVAFTWDDGFMDCYTSIAPVLEEFGVNAIMFVNPNFVEGDENYIRKFQEKIVMVPHSKLPMRWNHLKDLQERGFIIGAHTMDHFMINSDDLNTIKYQIESCKPIIEEKLGVPCEYFAFPYGRLEHANPISIDIACNTYKYVFSQSDYKHYFSFNGKVINRRHFEPFWPVSHIKYFISVNKNNYHAK